MGWLVWAMSMLTDLKDVSKCWIGKSATGSVIALVLGSSTGCSLTPRDVFTATEADAAQYAGLAELKIWADAPSADIARWLWQGKPAFGCNANYLALSGGGSNGSFGAGLLKGWSEAGTRPQFDIVSGVSTGALIAPFAFLGTDTDAKLELMFSGDLTKNLGKIQNPFRSAVGGGLLDPEPLRRLIERFATIEMLSRIADEHRRGRRLLVVTTNLDAQRPVLWNMGAIAASNRPDALRLFRDVLLASASVPAIYPPVMISAEAGNRSFKEMHVDGGVTTQVFINPDIVGNSEKQTAKTCTRHPHLWVVINNLQPPDFRVVPDNSVSIAMRSYSTVIKAETNGIVMAAYEASKRLRYDFNLAYIKTAMGYEPTDPFRPSYMKAVFELGEQAGRDGTAWQKSPAQLTAMGK